VLIAYKTRRRAVGLAMQALRGNDSPHKPGNDKVTNAKILQDIDGSYRCHDAESDQDLTVEDGDDTVKGYDVDDDVDMMLHVKIDAPSRPAPGKDCKWISPHLRIAAIEQMRGQLGQTSDYCLSRRRPIIPSPLRTSRYTEYARAQSPTWRGDNTQGGREGRCNRIEACRQADLSCCSTGVDSREGATEKESLELPIDVRALVDVRSYGQLCTSALPP
jgi:hypothetical protein